MIWKIGIWDSENTQRFIIFSGGIHPVVSQPATGSNFSPGTSLPFGFTATSSGASPRRCSMIYNWWAEGCFFDSRWPREMAKTGVFKSWINSLGRMPRTGIEPCVSTCCVFKHVPGNRCWTSDCLFFFPELFSSCDKHILTHRPRQNHHLRITIRNTTRRMVAPCRDSPK